VSGWVDEWVGAEEVQERGVEREWSGVGVEWGSEWCEWHYIYHHTVNPQHHHHDSSSKVNVPR
jgi:hypothetical protein